MLKQSMICGAFALFLSSVSVPSDAHAQSFVLSPTNGTKPTSRTAPRAAPVYTGGVTVAYDSEQNGQNLRRRQVGNSYMPAHMQKQKGPLAFGRRASTQRAAPGYLSQKNIEDMSPQEIRQMRMEAYKTQQKAASEARHKAYVQAKHDMDMAKAAKERELIQRSGYKPYQQPQQ